MSWNDVKRYLNFGAKVVLGGIIAYSLFKGSERTHIVKRNETLTDIAKQELKYNNKKLSTENINDMIRQIQEYNPGLNPDIKNNDYIIKDRGDIIYYPLKGDELTDKLTPGQKLIVHPWDDKYLIFAAGATGGLILLGINGRRREEEDPNNPNGTPNPNYDPNLNLDNSNNANNDPQNNRIPGNYQTLDERLNQNRNNPNQEGIQDQDRRNPNQEGIQNQDRNDEAFTVYRRLDDLIRRIDQQNQGQQGNVFYVIDVVNIDIHENYTEIKS